MFRGLFSIIYKETFHILRDPKTLFMMLVLPGMNLTVFGYAIDMDLRDIPTIVYNLDGRSESRDLIDTFSNSGYFDINQTASSDEDLVAAIVRGEARIGIKIPPDYTDDVLTGDPAKIQVLIDGSNSGVAMQALNVANAIALRESIEILSGSVGGPDELPVEARGRLLFNPDMRTPNFMVPGLIALTLQTIPLILTAFAVVREKENGTLEQLMVTPVSRLGLMVGKLIPYAAIGMLVTWIAIAIMRFVFHVPIAGSLFLLGSFSGLFLFSALGLGLLISTFANNQIQAVQLAVTAELPSALLSGFMFPRETMPTPIYIFSEFLPATHFIAILRGIVLRGAGFMDLWQHGAWLAGIGFVLISVSAMRFHKTLD